MKNKIFMALALAVILILMLSVASFAASETDVRASGTFNTDFTWQLQYNGVLTITGEGDMKDYTAAKNTPWYYYSSYVKSVVIEEGVTSIGNYSFSALTELTTIQLPSTITTVGNYAFSKSTALESIELPESVTTMGKYTFYGCTALESVKLSDNIASLGESTFSGCTALKSVTLPFALTRLPYATFANCTALESVTIPFNVMAYDTNVLYKVPETAVIYGYNGTAAETLAAEYSLTFTGEELPDAIRAEGTMSTGVTWAIDTANVLTIEGAGAMDDYSEASEQPWYAYRNYITEIYIGENITHIGNYAFASLSKITGTSLGSGVTSVGDCAFYLCKALEQVTIPDNVTTVGKDVFRGCTALTSVTLPNAEVTYGVGVFQGCTSLPQVDIPEKMTVIPNYMFYNCTALAEVNFHDNVTTIGAGAFGYCFDDGFGDVEVILPKNLTTINGNAFEYAKMKNIILPEGLTNIGSKAFYKCSNLERITIPSSMTAIGDNVFEYCDALKEINMPTVTEIGDSAFYSIGAETLTLPDGLVSIGSRAFAASDLKTIVIPESVTTIGSNAFASSKLESITFPGTVKSLGDDMFRHCQSLTEVTISEGIEEIGTWAFAYCTALEKVTLPKTLKTIDSRAFMYCKALKAIEIPDGMTIINDSFENCTALEEITIPQSVILIDEDAFSGAPATVVVKGYTGSMAETYAQNNSYTFVSLGDITEQVVVSKAFNDTTSWSLTNTGKLIFSGTGRVPAVSTLPWDNYRNIIKTLIIEEGITSVGEISFDYVRKVEKVILPSSLKSIDEDLITSMPTGVVFEGYSKTWVEYLITKNKRTFTAIGEAPYHEMFTGTMENTGITWAVDNCGTVFLRGSGKMASYSYASQVPWYGYRDLINNMVIEEGITTLGNLQFDEFPTITQIEIPYTIGKMSSNLSDFVAPVTVKGYTHSLAEHFALAQGHTFVSMGEAPIVVIATGSAGDDDNATYTINTRGVLTISGTGTTEYCSSDFARSWDYYTSYIKKIVIEHGITRLQTFYLTDCTNLESIQMSYSVFTSWLNDVPDDITVIGYTNSHADKKAQSLNLKFESLGIMPEDDIVSGKVGDAKWGLNGYGKLTLSGNGAFDPDSGIYPWEKYSDYILEVYVEEGITRIGSGAFYRCDDIDKITLPVSLEYISLYNISTSVDFYVYQYSAAHDQLESSGRFDYEFIGVAPLKVNKEGTFGDNITWRYYNHRILELDGTGDMPTDIEIPWKSYRSKILKITMADTITSIAPYAFSDAKVTEITIPSTVTKIGENAFRNLDHITEVVIPDSVTEMDSGAFSGCRILEKITFSSNIILADFDVVESSSALKIVSGRNDTFAERLAAELGAEFVSTGDVPERALINVPVSDKVYFEVDNLGDFIFLGEGEIPDQITGGLENTPWGPYLTDNTDTIIISGTITRIGNRAFQEHDFDNFVIEEGVKSIGEYAFSSLPITELKLPSTVEEIGVGAFSQCYSLQSVWLSENLEVIPTDSFRHCYNLKYVEIPEWIGTIEQNAFYNADNVEYIHYLGSEWHWNNYVTGEENLPSEATLLFKSSLPEEVSVTITNVKKTSKKVTVTVESTLRGGEKAFIAAYNSEGILIEIVNIELDTTSYTLDKNTAVIKVFVWDATENMLPLAEVYAEEV